jgi:hypothetical protein
MPGVSLVHTFRTCLQAALQKKTETGNLPFKQCQSEPERGRGPEIL